LERLQGRHQLNIRARFAAQSNANTPYLEGVLDEYFCLPTLLDFEHTPPFARNYDPAVGQTNPQTEELWPPLCPRTLQCPNTASSGRRLMAVTEGGSYFFLFSNCADVSLMQRSSVHTSRMAFAASTPNLKMGQVIQDRKKLIVFCWWAKIDLMPLDSPDRLQQAHIGIAACAETTFPVRRNFVSDDHCPQMCYLTKEINGSLFIAVLHLSVRGTHPAK